jgi:glucan-binding YG repeat protein
MKHKERFKLHKAGKKWCVMLVTTGLAVCGLAATANASDDNGVANTNEPQVVLTAETPNNNTKANTGTSSATSNQNAATTELGNGQNADSGQQATATTNTKLALAETSENTTTITGKNATINSVKNGWVKNNNQWTYYTNGQVQSGRHYVYLPTIQGTGNNWYLTENGTALSGVQKWFGTYYDFDSATYLKVTNNYVQSQWGDWYLFGNDGQIQTMVQKWAGTYYYFDPITYLRVDNDYRQSQWGDWYLFGNDGKIQTGVQKWAGTYYYFDPNTYLRVDNDYRQSQWGDWYMFGGDGRIISGFCNWYGSLYFFNPSTYLKLVNTFFNGNGYWNNWDTYWADYNGIVHGVQYFSQFTPVWAGWGCAGASLTMLLSIRNIWPGVGNVIAGIPMGGNGGQIGNQYNGAGFGRVIQPNALAAYAHRWYGGVTDSSGATIGQIVNSVENGHPVLYYGWSPYDAGGARNHCKIILGYNRTNGLFHVYDPCYGNGGWGPYSEGRSAYDLGWNAWVSWGKLAGEYSGQALTIY